MNWKIVEEDVRQFAETFSLWNELRGASFMVTGATGLIGGMAVRCLKALDERYQLGIKIVCPVRSIDKAKKIFGDIDGVEFIVHDFSLSKPLDYSGRADYIIHGASPTASAYFVSHPVETINTQINGVTAIMEYARTYDVKGVVILSSLEVYGSNYDDKLITEDMQGYVNPLSVRSSYNMGKRMSECLAHSYAKEYGVHVRMARLTQVCSAGIDENDNRAVAQFTKKIVNGEDIILLTQGGTSRTYCYSIDAVSALLYILLRGEDGTAYNVANSDTYISIRELAEFLCATFGDGKSKVVVKADDIKKHGYPPETHLRLDTSALQSLGWKPLYDRKAMFERMIEYLK